MTHQRIPKIVRVVAFGLAVSLGTAACGGGDEPNSRGKTADELRAERDAQLAKMGKGKAAQTAQGDMAEVISLPLPKPGWKQSIQPYFSQYLTQRSATPKNVFETQVLAIVPRPKLEEPETEERPTEIVEVAEEERGPLQQYPLKDYKLLLVMSGTAIPKAVVVDPKGQAFILQQDTRIGNRGGIVESVTQYMVVVREPDSDKPIKMTIKPPYIDLASQPEIAEESVPAGGFVVPSAILGGERPAGAGVAPASPGFRPVTPE